VGLQELSAWLEQTYGDMPWQQRIIEAFFRLLEEEQLPKFKWK
jgi:hypothetical protein